jgi:hypothetical protein
MPPNRSDDVIAGKVIKEMLDLRAVVAGTPAMTQWLR